MTANSGDFSSILLTVFVFGMIAGLLFAVLISYLLWIIEDFVRKRAQTTEIAEQIHAHEEQPVEVDDERITCPSCWERRHPGHQWPFVAWDSWCPEHLFAEPEWGEIQKDQKACYALTLP
jgi:hypothetical protein